MKAHNGVLTKEYISQCQREVEVLPISRLSRISLPEDEFAAKLGDSNILSHVCGKVILVPGKFSTIYDLLAASDFIECSRDSLVNRRYIKGLSWEQNS